MSHLFSRLSKNGHPAGGKLLNETMFRLTGLTKGTKYQPLIFKHVNAPSTNIFLLSVDFG